MQHGTRKFEPAVAGLHRRIYCCGTLAQQCANFDWTRTQEEKLSHAQRLDSHNSISILFTRRRTYCNNEQELRRRYDTVHGLARNFPVPVAGVKHLNNQVQASLTSVSSPFLSSSPLSVQDRGCESSSYSCAAASIVGREGLPSMDSFDAPSASQNCQLLIQKFGTFGNCTEPGTMMQNRELQIPHTL